MNAGLKMLFFCGGRRREQLFLNGRIIDLSVAQVLCDILRLEDVFFEKLKIVPGHLEEIADAYHEAIKGAYMHEQDEVGSGFLKEAKDRLKRLLESASGNYETLMMELLVYLPCFEAYNQTYNESERRLPNEQYRNEVMDLVRSGHGQDPKVEEYMEIFNRDSHFDDAATAWRTFINFMADDIEYGPWFITAKVIFDKTDSFRSYAKRLEDCLNELWILKKNLEASWDRNSDQLTFDSANVHLIWPRAIMDKAEIFPPEPAFAYEGNVFGVTSFTQLVTAELILLEKLNRPIRKCKLCSRYFVPYQLKSMYCQNPNPDYKNQTCARIGSQKKFMEDHAFRKTPLGQKYTRNYNAYSKWSKENIARAKNVLNELMYAYTDADTRQQRLLDVKIEISNKQDAWRKDAEKAVKMYTQGEISEEEYLRIIELPKRHERSPRMAELVREWKEYMGK